VILSMWLSRHRIVGGDRRATVCHATLIKTEAPRRSAALAPLSDIRGEMGSLCASRLVAGMGDDGTFLPPRDD